MSMFSGIDNIQNINYHSLDILEGKYSCRDLNIINIICEKIKHIYCTLYFTKFLVCIKKNKNGLKIKIETSAISKELVNFLNNLPYNLDKLVISQIIYIDALNNLPINLKKLKIINYSDNDYFILESLKKFKIPFDCKIILVKDIIEKKQVIFNNGVMSVVRLN